MELKVWSFGSFSSSVGGWWCPIQSFWEWAHSPAISLRQTPCLSWRVWCHHWKQWFWTQSHWLWGKRAGFRYECLACLWLIHRNRTWFSWMNVIIIMQTSWLNHVWVLFRILDLLGQPQGSTDFQIDNQNLTKSPWLHYSPLASHTMGVHWLQNSLNSMVVSRLAISFISCLVWTLNGLLSVSVNVWVGPWILTCYRSRHHNNF